MAALTDTVALLRTLESISERIDRTRKDIEELRKEIFKVEMDPMVLVRAAEAAGMPANRAADYMEEYEVLMTRSVIRLEAAEASLRDAASSMAGATHIARVVPQRCPNAPVVGGVKVLDLTH